ncbi:hypothetical protein [Streptomyces sp. NRRL S-87]|uniref:hypothetical protein n=1 Tax=Streptomyces sp. NRRL S-87 TaxID=1463920 RepID=UPI0004BF28AA|nr:hypothetical protein [Streptomyces sp. NRRL S-87]
MFEMRIGPGPDAALVWHVLPRDGGGGGRTLCGTRTVPGDPAGTEAYCDRCLAVVAAHMSTPHTAPGAEPAATGR